MILLRGNRDWLVAGNCHSVSSGFRDDVVERYGSDIYTRLFDTVIPKMPVAAIINGKIWASNGGPPYESSVTLNEMQIKGHSNSNLNGGIMNQQPMWDFEELESRFTDEVTCRFLKEMNVDMMINSYSREEPILIHMGKFLSTCLGMGSYSRILGNQPQTIHIHSFKDILQKEGQDPRCYTCNVM